MVKAWIWGELIRIIAQRILSCRRESSMPGDFAGRATTGPAGPTWVKGLVHNPSIYTDARNAKSETFWRLFDLQPGLAQGVCPGTVTGTALDRFVELAKRVAIRKQLRQLGEAKVHIERAGVAGGR